MVDSEPCGQLGGRLRDLNFFEELQMGIDVKNLFSSELRIVVLNSFLYRRNLFVI